MTKLHVSEYAQVTPIYSENDFYLLSNDDGFFADGLKVIQKVVAEFGTVCTFAPSENCSGVSSFLTLHSPIVVNAIADNVFAVKGKPADCVHAALSGLLKHQPKRVISGVNMGANLGDDVLYSGTVAAAQEGRFLAKPSIAFSITEHQPQHLATAEVAVRWVMAHLAEIDAALPANAMLNVNIPDIPVSELKGYKITRLGKRGMGEDLIELTNPRGVKNYWIGLAGENTGSVLDSDFAAIEAGYVSLTPLISDLTHEAAMAKLASITADGLVSE